MSYEFTETCPYCKLPVIVRYTERGICHDPAYDLIADTVWHSVCWDKQVEEYPVDLQRGDYDDR